MAADIEAVRVWKEKNPEKVAATRRRAALRRYGITPEDYDRMLAEQGGACAICSSYDPRARGGNFHVDHNHETGEVRALLCGPCNVAIGMLQEDPQRARNLANYLEAHRV